MGFNDFEWGVTLFAVNPDDLKDVVHTMLLDEALLCTQNSVRFKGGW